MPLAAANDPRFRTLARHFFDRFFDKESLSADGDEHANVVQIIAMLALPGAIVSLYTMVDHPLVRSETTRLWLRSGDRYVFVCYAMVVMGFVMTFKWDSLFPDRRDYLILTPLPISLREFFVAKVASLCAFLALFVIAINLFSCVIVPWVFAVRDNTLRVLLPALLAHAVAVFSASIFTALFFAALQGILLNLMAPSTFKRVSLWIQMISMTVLVTVLLIIPGISANVRPLVENEVRALDYIPVFWFLGIYEILNPEGSMIPMAPTWAMTAVIALLLVAFVFVLTYVVSYRRYSRKILEDIESRVFSESWTRRALESLLNRTFLRRPAQRATFYFIGRIFGRSAKHRLFIAMYGGIGLALTISSLFVLRRDPDFILTVTRQGLIEAPLILSFFVVSGLRAVFNIPYELGANWMFRVASKPDPSEYLESTRRWVFLHGILPIYALMALLELALLDPGEAIFHLAFGLAMAGVLTEALFFHFNKVPFTCSYLPPKSHMAFLAGAYLYGFTLYTATAAGLESWVGASPERMLLFFAALAAGLIWIRRYRRSASGPLRELVYEDEGDPIVQQLHLSP